jgi:hypothetical protein
MGELYPAGGKKNFSWADGRMDNWTVGQLDSWTVIFEVYVNNKGILIFL